MHGLFGWYWWLTGARDEGGRAYGLWSGFGGSMPDVLLITGFGAYLYHMNCHNKGCRHVTRHVTAKGYRLCRKCVAKPLDELDLHTVHPDHQ